MAIITWRETLTQSVGFGSVVSAGTRASCIPSESRITLPCCYFYPGLCLKFTLAGIISTTTAGVAGPSIAFDICMGAAGDTIVFETQPMPLVTALRNNRPFLLVVDLLCKSVGIDTGTTFFASGNFQCESLIGGPAPTAGGNPSLCVPLSAPSVGPGTDNTVASTIDVFCTLVGGANGMFVNSYRLEALN